MCVVCFWCVCLYVCVFCVWGGCACVWCGVWCVSVVCVCMWCVYVWGVVCEICCVRGLVCLCRFWCECVCCVCCVCARARARVCACARAWAGARVRLHVRTHEPGVPVLVKSGHRNSDQIS